ncbi:MBL fold metallo-hydrolase [Tahibacter amnicola]|uniref:MBL fold metallo-hydrolase n=1 Tax=Tahibacter amnicola TaxID=2976241 RepID=A0ABY6BJE3_9GAMM|nr:MBL fold metallo-hydrolase [Tahibacter amnicola]UXI70131.1 MBL fold metallo-hydrolase [Tahibacter amnicola]
MMQPWFRLKYRGILALFLVAAAPVVGAASLQFPAQWVHGMVGEPVLQVHEAAPGTWILRQSRRSHFEAPFLYLLAGEKRALLLDTGAEPQAGPPLPLRETIDRLLAEWSATRSRGPFPLIVAHTHAHKDHVFGDAQFHDRADTQVVGTKREEVAAFFGLPRWPQGEAMVDLGQRPLIIVPLPGHEPSHIAIYDAATRSLLSGDSLYPGLLTVRDWQAYRASAASLAAFVGRHDVQHVLGAHIEARSTARQLYPLETAYQPDEHVLALQASHVRELAQATARLGDFVADEVHDDFTLTRVSPPSADHPSTHGMVLFGQREVYLSHMPMFHSPHDYQLILEAELPPDVLAAWRQDAAKHPDTFYSIAPTGAWVLTEGIAEGKTFAADLFRGHFERGGARLLQNVTVTVKRLIHFRRFEAGQAPAGRWIPFGSNDESYLAHRIEGAPDMDQIVMLSGAPGGEEWAHGNGGALAAGDRVGTESVRRVIYTEFDDLKQ